MQERIDGLQRQLLIDERVFAPLRASSKQGCAALLDVAEKERVLELARRELAEARRQLVTLSYESDKNQAALHQQLADPRSKLDLVTLRAPVNGTVIDHCAQSGQVVSGDKPLLQLVPTDEPQAQVFAPNQDLAFLRIGQQADIALSAYDKSIYGTVQATVSLISQDALPPVKNTIITHFRSRWRLRAKCCKPAARGLPFSPAWHFKSRSSSKSGRSYSCCSAASTRAWMRCAP